MGSTSLLLFYQLPIFCDRFTGRRSLVGWGHPMDTSVADMNILAPEPPKSTT